LNVNATHPDSSHVCYKEEDMSDLLNRRSFLWLAAGAGSLSQAYAFSSDFWNKKEPAEWTGAEIDQLTNKSPWAKEVTATAPGANPVNRGGMGYPGGMGGGMGGGRRGGGMSAPGQSYKGIVRWESAKSIRDGLKTELPENLANHYVISVGGIPLDAGSRSRNQSQDDSSQSDQDKLDRLKSVTLLSPKEKRDLQPGIVIQKPAGYGDVYFAFAKDLVTLRPEDKEVTFSTQFGTVQVKTKFNLKDMLYHGELAV
jgi:hypothetical protein